jgi:hypothetical protein
MRGAPDAYLILRSCGLLHRPSTHRSRAAASTVDTPPAAMPLTESQLTIGMGDRGNGEPTVSRCRRAVQHITELGREGESGAATWPAARLCLANGSTNEGLMGQQ